MSVLKAMQKALVALATQETMSVEALSRVAEISVTDMCVWLDEASRHLPIRAASDQVSWTDAIPPLNADHPALRAIECLVVVPLCASTNDEAFAVLAQGARSCCVVAERQTGGRGQHGRRWTAPWASGITVTAGVRWPAWPSSAGALPLAVGIHIAEALEIRLGEPIQVKWPNDLYLHGRKLGGILVETRGVSGGECQVVIGVGVNLRRPDQSDAPFERPAAAIGEILPESATESREPWVALVAEAITAGVDDALSETPHWHKAWVHRDWLADNACSVERDGITLHGFADGVDTAGRLRFRDHHGVIHHLATGRVRRI